MDRRTLDRRTFLGTAAALSLAAPALRAQSGPIRFIFPFAAGGAGDALTRIVADEVGRALGEPAIVEARPGAGGQIGTQAVINAAPDGRTLLLTPIAPVVIHPIVFPQLPYDPVRDLAPVSLVTTFDFALAVHPDTPAKTLAELVAWVKQDPRRATYGSPGVGNLPHFFGALLAETIGVPLVHAPYRGSAPALTDLVGGQVPMVITTTSDVTELAKGGRIRILAVSGRERSPFLPDVPTFTEAGVAIAGGAWYGLFAKAGSPPEILGRISRAVMAAMRDAAVKEKVLGLAMVPTGSTPEELGRVQKQDIADWTPAVKASGFRPT
ncbi:Bug family tripartite tricarboxylate transporter substrate binding protein [Phreatobacter oligotrophus]|uniref:Bug family tripartite tricarboxylate transporter substrate binding protein n=1 Tax=Phreatobacter oligotrophus TaxID=1122261 RepID=UPI00235508EE|nr:Bug family tripartite tricarboxylate transporter substrate binding protein [Phreatobacter oligotrophus]MBX9989197.1 Bug family tripartite tricarboxylate transporter substrate binding protein [Phreatobacter oligotrophus]